MKKLINSLLVFSLIICLSSCATIRKSIELSQEQANIQSIEIYNSDSAYYEGDIHLFRLENEPIVVLKTEEIPTFIEELNTLEYVEEKIFLPIVMDGGYDYDGYIIAVVYLDGGYDIVASGGLYHYAIGKNGQGRHAYDYADYCGETPWTSIFEKYIEQ